MKVIFFLKMKFLASAFKSGLIFVLSLSAISAYPQNVSQYTAIPPVLAENTPPLIMLAMSVDHQLFYKAYTDYEDVDGDGDTETTYENDIEYGGYFDSSLCYVYSSGRFQPSSIISHTVTSGGIDSRGYCNDSVNNEWSGNFLNWSTMTRIDQVRAILYGGYRSTDSGSLTVLERSYLPNDAHSFAKYYNETDLGGLTPFANITVGNQTDPASGITICNTTYYSGSLLSQDVTEPPLARVVAGNYSLWNAHERAQCIYDSDNLRSNSQNNDNNSSLSGIYAYPSYPSLSDQAQQANGSTVGDYVVRVEACNSSFIDVPFSSQQCQEYPNGNYKPVGLLQEFGEDGSSLWGLISGSYEKNKSGGVLRKDIGSVADEINVDTNGSFTASPSNGGIISALNALRIANYGVDDGDDYYRYNNSDSCAWGRNFFSDGECTNWGNPFSEILQECYSYFADGNPNPAYSADDTGLFPGLTTDSTWNNPQDADTKCAALNVIAFNSSSVSYDADQLSNESVVSGFTDAIGAAEGIHGSNYFVGETGANNDQLCTSKQVGGFSDVRGTCPDSPRLSGSYQSAGLAYQAYTEDQRSDIEGEQLVETWGVELSPGIPNVRVHVPGTGTDPETNPKKYVSILPACRNETINGNCGLVDFKIVSQSDDGSTASGSFYVNWEDSEQGGDYDQDMNGVISYVLTSSNLTVTTDVIGQSTGNQMGFGYVLSGTSSDGFQVHSGINDYVRESGCPSSNPCKREQNASSESYLLGSSTATLLQSPLFYAAKWGGFTDTDGNGIPIGSDVGEWDADEDGLPDNYVLAINPLDLKESLRNLVLRILERTASGTAAAISAQTGGGEGAIYQAIYTPRLKADSGEVVTWAGSLRGFFIDRFGRFREDTNGDAVLDDADNAISFEYREEVDETFIITNIANDDGTLGAEVGDGYEIFDTESARPLWDAQEQLGSLTNYTSNRTNYADSASTGRFVFTAIDRDPGDGTDLDGQILDPTFTSINPGQSSTVDGAYPFIASNFSVTTGNDFRYFGLGDSVSQSEVDNLINFIRGDETVPSSRNRTLGEGDDAGGTKLLLGDFVHSSPAVVSAPSQNYDVIFGDETYEDYVEAYRNRRSVVYIGANDGMLHAFNGGFFDASTNSFQLALSGETAHPLGSELWAYVPFNVLPHLQWLKEENYSHVYYVDGPVQTFDVNIFDSSDPTYPGGWGTILVVGLRFGGGDFSLDHDGDPNTPDITTRSSYIIMDVTDPESRPKLIAEITDEDLGFTLSVPNIVKSRQRTSSGTFAGTTNNAWYLVFGSGPGGGTDDEKFEALDQGISHQDANLFVFDLIDKELMKVALLDESNAVEAASFTSGVESIDWDLNFQDDAIYYGLVNGTPATPGGKLKRGKLEFSSAGELVVNADNLSTDLFNDFNRAFSATPKAVSSSEGEWWVYAGTGRFLAAADNLSSQQQYFFGLKEPVVSGTPTLENSVDASLLLETTNIDVFDDGRVREDATSLVTLSVNGSSESLTESGNFDDVRDFVLENTSGWYFAFETPPHTLNNSIRTTTQAAQAGDSLLIAGFETTGEVCEVTGQSFLYAPHFETGIPAPFAPLSTDPNVTLSPPTGSPTSEPDSELVLMGTVFGDGMPSEIEVLAEHTDGDDCAKVSPQLSTGEIAEKSIGCEGVPEGRQSWREIPIQ